MGIDQDVVTLQVLSVGGYSQRTSQSEQGKSADAVEDVAIVQVRETVEDLTREPADFAFL